MKTFTAKQIKNYLVSNYGKINHCEEGLYKASKLLAKEYKVRPIEIFKLIIENESIEKLHTHSYNFQTANGREIIEEFKYTYKNLTN